MKKNRQGFTLVEIMIVVAIIGLLAAIAIPSFMRARMTSQANACINNLRQIESGKEQLGMENGLVHGTQIDLEDLVGPRAFIKQWPVCPNVVEGDGAEADVVEGASEEDKALASYDTDSPVGMRLGFNAECLIRGDEEDFPHALPDDVAEEEVVEEVVVE